MTITNSIQPYEKNGKQEKREIMRGKRKRYRREKQQDGGDAGGMALNIGKAATGRMARRRPYAFPVKEGSALRGRDALSSHGLHRSTFGEEGLNCRVRNGTG